MDARTWIALGALLISVLSLIYSGSRNGKGDASTAASTITTVIVKLENVMDGINDIKSEMKSMKEDVQTLHERVVVCEQSMKSLHKRVDALESKQ